jgi:DNA-binding transcriptional ArsR family regulator
MAFPKREIFPQFDQQMALLNRALGYPARIFILLLLHNEGPMKFTDLVKRVPLNESTVTGHLKFLREEGLVNVEVHGLVNTYSVKPESVESMFDKQFKMYRLLGGTRMIEMSTVVVTVES